MKIFGKLTAALLALFMVMSLFAACGKDDDKDDDKEKDNDTVQTDDENNDETDNAEETEEPTAQLEFFTQAEESTGEVNTTGVTGDPTVKVPTTKTPTITKAPTTKAPTTKAPTTKAPDPTKAPTTKPDATQKEEPKPTNVDLLIGTWETTIVTDGLPITIQFKLDINGTMQMDFTASSYEKMIKKAVELEMSQVTDEDLAESGFASREEAEEYLYDLIEEEVPYDELRSMILCSGTWKLSGDTLTVTVDGEDATAQTKLSEGKTTFELKDPTGESITLTKV